MFYNIGGVVIKSYIINYIDKNKIDKNLIYVHNDSNRSSSKNRIGFKYRIDDIQDYKYIAQYFIKYDLLIIWDKSQHKKGTYCYNADISKAINAAKSQIYSFEKGIEFQAWKICKNYACHSKDIKTLLDLIYRGGQR